LEFAGVEILENCLEV